MRFDKQQFEGFLGDIGATRAQVDAICKSAASMHELSEVGMTLLWQTIFDVMMTTRDPEERLKWGNLIEKIFSATTARRALELREKKAQEGTDADPLDAEAMNELQHKLKLL